MSTDAEHAAAGVPPNIEARFLRGIVAAAWARVAEARPELVAGADPAVWMERVVEVLLRNIGTGRYEAAQHQQLGQPDGQATLLSYAVQVLVVLLSEWERIDRLRRGDTTDWAAVIDRLERLAFHWFGPAGREEWAAWEAREVAARTCADLWQWLQTHPYPFDVAFERWSARALNNRLHETVRIRGKRGRVVHESLDQPGFGAEDGPTLGDLLPDRRQDEWQERAADREVLLQALGQLDRRQRRVIYLWYFEQWPADEIAADVGQTVGNVYVLRFRAIEKLRKIVAGDEGLGLAESARPAKPGRRPRSGRGGSRYNAAKAD